VRATYPFVRITTTSYARLDSRLAYGFVAGPGAHETTVTRPDLFSRYFIEQMRLLIANHGVPVEIGESDEPIPIGALLTGCRYCELAAMTVEDFNSDAGTVRVRASKSGKPRHVVLTQEGRDFIAQRAAGRPGSGRLFLRDNGKVWGKSEQQRPLTAACTAARIDPPVNFHGLRHTYASRLTMRGVPLAVIAAQLGHADTRMVEKHYGHLAPSYIADTVHQAFGSLGIVELSNVEPIAAAR
jgi:integrase